MKEKENIYEIVPGQGKRLADGTWWTNCTAKVGEVCSQFMIPGNYTKKSEVVEVGRFGGLPFARWKDIT